MKTAPTGPRRSARAVAAMAVVLSLVASPTVGVAAPAAARAANSDCVDGWRRQTVPSALAQYTPQGAASLGDAPAWMVGLPGDVLPQRPFIARFSGGAWRTVGQPFTRYGSFNAVDAFSAGAAWAVGSLGKPTGRPMVARWNGSSWSSVGVPTLGGTRATFSDVTAVNGTSAWAVGARLIGGRMQPIALLRGAAAWSNFSPAVAASEEGGLTAVERASDGSVWAGGWRTAGGIPGPWLLRRNGSAWQAATLEAVPAGGGAITDLFFRGPGDGWLVGYVEASAGGGSVPLIQHWDGSAWHNVDGPWVPADSVVPTSVALNAAGVLTVAGTALIDGVRRGAMASRSGNSWSVRSVPAGAHPGTWLTAADAVAGGAFVVGKVGGVAASFISCSGGMATARANVVASTAAPQEDSAAVATVALSGSALPVPHAISGTVARNMTAAAGLDMRAMTYEGVVGDFNGDTLPDLFINRHVSDSPLLMLNSATGHFSQLNVNWVFQDRHGCAAADVDQDDALDLFCSVGAAIGTRMTIKELLLHPGSGNAQIASEEYGLVNAFARGRAATFLNLDGDAYPDLFVTAEPDRIDGFSSANRLYRNVDGTHFEPAPDSTVNRSQGGEDVQAADLDLDGDDDLVLSSGMAVDGMRRGARVFINEAGDFVDRTQALGITPIVDVNIEIADFNGDSLPDIAQLGSAQLRIMLATGSGYQLAYSLGLQRAKAMAVGDVNGDNRPDIYISQETGGSDVHVMLVNNGSGHGFSSMTIPQVSSGSANDVLAIDYDANGRTDFVTLNGRYVTGPIRLIAFFPE